MRVQAIWSFDVNTEGLDKNIHIGELAKNLTMREMASLLENKELSAEDFNYLVIGDSEEVEEKKTSEQCENEDQLTFYEEMENVIGCMEYWERRVGEYVMELNEGSLSEDECVMEDTQKALEFIRQLPSIISGACVLAVYAGENWAYNQTKYGFGADGYEYCDKYIQGGMELAEVYGTEDFHNDFSDYFKKNICPMAVEEKKVSVEKGDRLKTILYNAISLLIDETFEQYDDAKEWLAMMLNNLDVSKEELLTHGIKITVDGSLSVEESKKEKKKEIKPFATKKKMDNFIASDCFGLSFDEEHQDICEGDKVIFVNRNIDKILLPYVYVVERVVNGRYSFRKSVHINMVKGKDILNQFQDTY